MTLELSFCQTLETQSEDQSAHEMSRDFLIADDTAVTTHLEKDLQRLTDLFADVYEDFGLPPISVKKKQVMDQNVGRLTSINIAEHDPEAAHASVYLDSAVSDNLSLETESNGSTGKASTTLQACRNSLGIQ